MELTEHRTVKDTVDHQLKHFSSRENLLRLSESRQLILLFLRPWCVPELWICRLSSGLMPCVRQLPWRKDLEFDPAFCWVGWRHRVLNTTWRTGHFQFKLWDRWGVQGKLAFHKGVFRCGQPCRVIPPAELCPSTKHLPGVKISGAFFVHLKLRL